MTARAVMVGFAWWVCGMGFDPKSLMWFRGIGKQKRRVALAKKSITVIASDGLGTYQHTAGEPKRYYGANAEAIYLSVRPLFFSSSRHIPHHNRHFREVLFWVPYRSGP